MSETTGVAPDAIASSSEMDVESEREVDVHGGLAQERGQAIVRHAADEAHARGQPERGDARLERGPFGTVPGDRHGQGGQ
jgi:hypothetical protein